MSWDTAIRTVLVDCLAIKEDENLLIVTDPGKRSIAQALYEGGMALGADAILAEMAERETHGTEPPPHVAAAMLASDVLIAPTTKSLSHTEARRAACAAGCRGATMPDITEDMLLRTMAADHVAIKARSQTLARLLSDGSEVTITSPEGTDVTFSIAGRDGISDDGDITTPGAFGNLPAGEGFIAPLEGQTRGRIVFDGSIWPIGRLSQPLSVEIQDGYAVSFSGPDADAFEALIGPYGKEAYAVAELGIGTNEKATLTGNVLEDEKILGTIHVAFGDNHSFGGTIRVASHQDGIVLHPTVSIDGSMILDAGKPLFD